MKDLTFLSINTFYYLSNIGPLLYALPINASQLVAYMPFIQTVQFYKLQCIHTCTVNIELRNIHSQMAGSVGSVLMCFGSFCASSVVPWHDRLDSTQGLQASTVKKDGSHRK